MLREVKTAIVESLQGSRQIDWSVACSLNTTAAVQLAKPVQ
jgi:hypothetical protein